MIVLFWNALICLQVASGQIVDQQSEKLVEHKGISEQQSFPETEYFALRDLYESTGGTNWIYRDNERGHWDFSGTILNPCTEIWQGVNCTCSESVCNVELLILPKFNLTGTLPDSLSDLTFMTSLLLNDNALHGSIPNTLSQCSQLKRLVLSKNALTGAIPSTIYDIHTLNMLDLSSNLLVDTISPLLSQLGSLSSLIINDNYFYGTIPSEIFQSLPFLTVLQLSTNNLNGSLPSTLQLCAQLQVFALNDNYFTGLIPDYLGRSLTKLISLQLDTNRLHGTIPKSIFNNTKLIQLTLGTNMLTGTIPNEIGKLTKLHILSLQENSLHGSLPYTFASLTKLNALWLYDNHLTGVIPLSLQNMRKLQYLQINNNMLSKTIPSTVLTLSSLVIFDVSGNLLTGRIDRDIFSPQNMHNSTLQYFMVYNNHLSGEMPDTISNLHFLKYLDISNNKFTSTIPSLYGLDDLLFLDLKLNHLHGTVPNTLCSLSKLYLFDLHSNLLSGTLPTELSELTHIQNLFLHDNILSGGLSGIVNATTQKEVLNIDVSNNQFSGALPADPFLIPTLETFAAATNCLSGSLPSEICAANRMTDLVLDGHKTASSCRRKIFPLLSSTLKTYTLSTLHDSTSVPSCVFTLSALQTLHLSGNSLTGALPEHIVVTPTLTDLSISHNMLKGKIPGVFMMGTESPGVTATRDPFVNLDMSYNKLTGILSPSFPSLTTEQTLSLQVNRFSGHMPSSLAVAEHISILDGNMFSCGDNELSLALGTDGGRDSDSHLERELPIHDPFYHIYECGSNTFNQSIYVWVLFFALLLLFVLLVSCTVCYRRRYSQSQLSRDSTAAAATAAVDRKQTSFSVDMNSPHTSDITNINTYSTAAVTAKDSLLAPHNNTWCSWLHELNTSRILYMSIFNSQQQSTATSSDNNSTAFPNNNNYLDMSCIIDLGVTLTNIRYFTLVIGITILCVLFPLYSALTYYWSSYNHEYAWFFSGAFLTGETPGIILYVALVLFAVLIVVLYDRYLHPVFNVQNTMGDTTTYINGMLTTFRNISNSKYTKKGDKRSKARYYSFVALLVVANCIVVIGINLLYVYISLNYSKNIVTVTQIMLAMFKLFWNSAVVFDFFAYLKRIYFASEYHNTDDEFGGMTNTVSILSITSNATYRRIENRDIVVQSFLVMFNNIACPCLAIAAISSNCFYNAVFLSPAVDSKYSFLFCVTLLIADGSCLQYVTETHYTSYVPPFIYSYQCSSIFITAYSAIYVYMFLLTAFGVPLFILTTKYFHSRWSNEVHREKSVMYRMLHALLPEILKPLEQELPSDYKPLLQIDKLCVVMISSTGILITFGALFPLLAFVIIASLLLTTYCVQLLVGRLIVLSQRVGYIHYTLRLNEECEEVQKAFHHIVFLLLVFACLFYAFFVYDIIGDDVGWIKALWAPVTLCILPLVIYLTVWSLQRGRAYYAVYRSDSSNSHVEVKYHVVNTTSNSSCISALHNSGDSGDSSDKKLRVSFSVPDDDDYNISTRASSREVTSIVDDRQRQRQTSRSLSASRIEHPIQQQQTRNK